MDKPIRILIAEDHPIVAEGYADLLKDSEDFIIVGISSAAQDVYYQLQFQQIDIILLDLVLPNLSNTAYSETTVGFDILDFIAEKKLKVQAIILSSHEEPSFILKAKNKGAKGYLSKKADKLELRAAIRMIANEKKEYFQKNLVSKIIEQKNLNGIMITQRERGILKDIANGLESKDIAEKQNLSFETIRDYRSSLMKKFNAKNAPHLIAIVSELGYLS